MKGESLEGESKKGKAIRRKRKERGDTKRRGEPEKERKIKELFSYVCACERKKKRKKEEE